MAEPGKFSLSAPFAALLTEFIIEDHGQVSGEQDFVIVHNPCGERVLYLNGAFDDSLTGLVQAAIDHTCES